MHKGENNHPPPPPYGNLDSALLKKFQTIVSNKSEARI
jgi:hypothetical protein